MPQLMIFVEPLLQRLWVASWHGAVATLLGLLLLRAFPRLPATLHCWVWRLVCIKMLVAFLCLGGVELRWLPPTAGPTSSVAEVDNTPVPLAHGDDTVSSTPNTGSLTRVEPSSGWDERRFLPVPTRRRAALAAAALWLVGVSWYVLMVCFDWRASLQLIRRSTPSDDNRLRVLLTDAANQLGIATPQCRLSNVATAPLVVGVWWRPIVLIPRDLANRLSESQTRLLLLHELAHIQRADLTWNWLGVIAGGLFFFNPCMWVVRRRWFLAQESACDEIVLREMPNSLAEYAATLLQCSVHGHQNRLGLVSAASTSVTSLRERIEKMSAQSISQRKSRIALGWLVAASIMGIIPWKLVPARADAERDSSPAETRGAEVARVSVIKTFSIAPQESRLAHDGVRPPMNYLNRRLQFRNQRGLRRTGQLGRSGAGGGIQSNVGGGAQFRGPNGSGAGGFAAGTIEKPNYVVALRLYPLDGPALVTVAEGTIAFDERGKEYKPMTQMGLARTSVPEFEESHPDCAGAYFHLTTKSRPKSFNEIKGKLRVTPITMHEAVFPLANLKQGVSKKTGFGRIRIGRFENDGGWKFEVMTPGPGEQRREVFKYAGMVQLELIDSEGKSHRPRHKSGSGGGGGGIGGAPGIHQITQIVAFEELGDGVEAEQLLVRIREPGPPREIPFNVRNVQLH